MRTRARTRLLALAVVLAAAVWAASTLLGGAGRHPSPLVPATGTKDPFAYDPDHAADFAARGAAGLAHVLYAKSPGGAVASAARTARYRPLVEQVAKADDLDPDELEGIILLESAGRPDAQASNDPHGAVGLTQILAETGQNLLKMHVDPVRSGRLTRQIARAARRGQTRRVGRLKAQRRRVDERYDPPKAIAATGRYLMFAKDQLGRDDLAIASYHMGVGNLQNVIRAFGAGDDTPYTELFYDSSPLRHARAWGILASLGDDSSTYLWRVMAAEDIMRRWRANPAALEDRAARMTAKNSAEEVLHPADATPRFAEPDDIDRAIGDGELTPLPVAGLRDAGVTIDPSMGELASKLDQPRSRYRALRPAALALLLYLARGTQAISHAGPLVLTSTVRDQRYQDLLIRRNIEATLGFSLHTTGWAFDIERKYVSRSQALAFQFMLDRLQALNLIAWVREPAAIHVTAGPAAQRLLGLLRPASP